MRFKLPLYIVRNYKGKPKNYWLTLNNYHTWHPQHYSLLKKQFTQEIQDQLADNSFEVPISIHYYYNRSRKSDPMNALSMINKFFEDALVAHGCIEDDHFKIVKFPVFHWIDSEKDVCYAEIVEDV